MFKVISKFRSLNLKNVINEKGVSTSAFNFRDVDDRREMLRSLPAADEGTAGEKGIDIDSHLLK